MKSTSIIITIPQRDPGGLKTPIHTHNNGKQVISEGCRKWLHRTGRLRGPLRRKESYPGSRQPWLQATQAPRSFRGQSSTSSKSRSEDAKVSMSAKPTVQRMPPRTSPGVIFIFSGTATPPHLKYINHCFFFHKIQVVRNVFHFLEIVQNGKEKRKRNHVCG